MSQASTKIRLLGIPFDANSSYLRGAAQAPPKIREALFCDSSNLWTENGADLGAAAIDDLGDLKFPQTMAEAFAAITDGVDEALAPGAPLILLGGDHSITYPILKAVGTRYRELTIVHFDAHPDLYDELDGNRFSHACPFARVMEAGLARRLIQIGIRTMNGHQRDQARRFGVEVCEMSRGGVSVSKLNVTGPVYISFDLDVLDPAFAPGVSHWEPGGMSVREVLSCINDLPGTLVAADIVEYNPIRDQSGRTAMVCAKILKEIAGKMLG